MDHLASILELNGSQSEIDWKKDYASEFGSLLLTNNRLLNAIIMIGHKATMGVAATLTELIQHRLKGFYKNIDTVKEFTPKIESLWAGAVDPLYMKNLDFNYEYFDENKGSTPYIPNWFILNYVAGRYINNSYYVHEFLVNLSMLTRHLMPNKKVFDKWFAETICKTAETFPCLYSYSDLNWKEDKNAKYDCSADAPVPREFFFNPNFKYSEDTAKSVLNVFLQSLVYKNNLWLHTPEKMLAKGFKGTPYEV